MIPARGVVALLAVVAVGCSVPTVAPPAPQVATEDAVVTPGEELEPRPAPSGSVRVAYPDPVGSWWQASVEDLAAGDLAALWSLPLYGTDPLGRPVPALARSVTVLPESSDWTVEVTLAPGVWSDGRPVTAQDVVATAEVLRVERPAAWGAFVGATAVAEGVVQLTFDRPFAGWSALLSTPPGVLPAHVLADGGLDAYADALPVTGGPFSLSATEPGLRSVFEAHPGSPLGAPGVERLEVLVVPDHDVALGLLATAEVDAVIGHVALDPAARRAQVPGTQGAAVFGGTRFELIWEPDDEGQAVRQRVAAGLDVAPFVEGLLRDAGRLPGGVLPVLEPLTPSEPPEAAAGISVGVQVVRTVEGLGLLARRLQAELEDGGVDTALVRLDPPQHLAEPVDVDARLRVVRVRPDRSLAALLADVGFDAADGLAADAAPVDADPVGPRVAASGPYVAVQQLLSDDPRLLPLAEVAVAHVWHPDRIAGLDPSGWPGLAFWGASSWSVPAG